MESFLNAKPIHPEFRTPDVWVPESSQAKFTNDERYSGLFTPLAGKNQKLKN